MTTVPDDENTNDPGDSEFKLVNWEFFTSRVLSGLYLCPVMYTNPPRPVVLTVDPLQSSNFNVLSTIKKPPPFTDDEPLSKVDDTNEATLVVVMWPKLLIFAVWSAKVHWVQVRVAEFS
jgi:hypothetical protein